MPERDGSSDDEPIEIHVWSINWRAVEVFEHCQISVVGAGFAVSYQGISAVEIHTACRLLRLPRGEWPDLLADVQYMGRVAATAINQRIARESKRD